MSISPDPAVVLTAVKTAIIEIEQLLTPGVNAVPYAFYEEGLFPYWVNEFQIGQPENTGTHTVLIPLEMQAVYAGGWMTEGVDGELEAALLLKSLQIVTGFKERGRLVCPTYPQGVAHLSPEGLVVGKPGRTNVSGGGSTSRALLFPLSVKFKFEINKK